MVGTVAAMFIIRLEGSVLSRQERMGLQSGDPKNSFLMLVLACVLLEEEVSETSG